MGGRLGVGIWLPFLSFLMFLLGLVGLVGGEDEGEDCMSVRVCWNLRWGWVERDGCVGGRMRDNSMDWKEDSCEKKER